MTVIQSVSCHLDLHSMSILNKVAVSAAQQCCDRQIEYIQLLLLASDARLLARLHFTVCKCISGVVVQFLNSMNWSKLSNQPTNQPHIPIRANSKYYSRLMNQFITYSMDSIVVLHLEEWLWLLSYFLRIVGVDNGIQRWNKSHSF